MPNGLIWDLGVRDNASPGFLRVAGAADKAAASTDRAALSMSKSVAVMGRVGSTLTKKLTLPLLGLAAVSVDQAAKYQKSLATIANATDQTSKQMQDASKGLLTIAKSTGTSLGQLTDGLYTVEKGGLRGAKALATVKAAAQGAKAENADLGIVTNALTSIMASYGEKIGSPVQAMDMLIRGSGLAKTSLQDFAGSLSTVVPLAAKAGIGFDQVAGAIDTLTQHGTSAQEATQELAFLIRGLQAPSQVAQKAMQQIGLSVVDVTKNLGKRGLIGTLSLVEDAVTKHLGKSGLVVVDTFKKSQSATADLQTMIQSMPKDLGNLSKGLLSGAVSIKTYQSDAKALGGAAGASALQFLSLYKGSKGFNDLLKSGQPAQRTAAAQLRDMLGGATGLNAALQLGGHSAKYFSDASASVAKAAQGAGADVLGWSRTQGLFSTKVDQAKANLQVMAVEIGTALLPAVSKIATGVSKVVTWFDSLSGTQKKVVGWSLGVLAAVGPILSIGARFTMVGRTIGSFVTTTGNALARFGTNAEGMSSRATIAVKGLTSALAGAAIGAAVGSFTQKASTTTKWLGVLGSAAAGAAIGFGTGGGPIGAVIGGLAGGVTALATSFTNTGTAADAATKQIASDMLTQKQDAADLLETLKSVNGAYNDTYKSAVISKLQSTGALNLSSKAGVSPQTITNAALGDSSAIGAINKRIAKLQAGTTKNGVTTYNTGQLAALQGIENDLGLVGPAARKAEHDWELYNAAQGKTLVSTKLLRGGVKNLTKELTGYGSALTTNADKQVANSAYAAHNSEVLKENVQTLNSAATAQLKHGVSVKTVAGDYLSQINALQANATKLGFNRDAVQTLIAKYAKVPKSVVTALAQRGISTINPALLGLLGLYSKVPLTKTTKLNADIATAKANVAFIRQQIAELPTYKSVTVNVSTAGNLASTYASQVPNFKPAAVGTIVRGPGGPTDDKAGLFALSNGEAVIPAKAVSRHPALIESLIREGRGLASGGVVESAFASLLANLGVGRAGQAGALGNGEAESNFNTAAYNAGSGATGMFQWLGGRLAGLRSLAASRGLSATSLSAQLAFFRQELLGPFRGVLNGLRNATSARAAATLFNQQFEISGDNSGNRENNAARIFDQLSSGKIAAGISSAVSVAKPLSWMARLLDAVKAKAGTAKTALGDMLTYRSGVVSTLQGAFDPTKYGSVNDLITGLHGATGTNNTYAKDLNRVRGMAKGNKTATWFVNQLAASGQTATLATLAGASRGQFAQVEKAVSGYNASLWTGGNAAVAAQYGHTTQQQAHMVSSLSRVVGELAHAVGKQEVNINFDGNKWVAKVVNSHEMTQVLARIEHEIAKGTS